MKVLHKMKWTVKNWQSFRHTGKSRTHTHVYIYTQNNNKNERTNWKHFDHQGSQPLVWKYPFFVRSMLSVTTTARTKGPGFNLLRENLFLRTTLLFFWVLRFPPSLVPFSPPDVNTFMPTVPAMIYSSTVPLLLPFFSRNRVSSAYYR